MWSEQYALKITGWLELEEASVTYLSLFPILIFSGLQMWKFLTQSFWRFGTPVLFKKTPQINKQKLSKIHNDQQRDHLGRIITEVRVKKREGEKVPSFHVKPWVTHILTGRFSRLLCASIWTSLWSVLSHLNGSIIGGTGFFRDNALAVLLFEAIFK